MSRPKSCELLLVAGVGVQFAQQHVGGEDVIAHGRVDAFGIAGHGRRVGPLLVKAANRAVRLGLDHTELDAHGRLSTGIAAMVTSARFCSWNSIISRMFMR